MTPALQHLWTLLRLDRTGDRSFVGQSQDLGWGAVFGGQVVGQALSAAAQTVPDDRVVHSLHGYFLRQGDAACPITYTVDPIRDGRSFTTRRVVAAQGGRPVFHFSASFQTPESGLHHQDAASEVRGPMGLRTEQELAQSIASRLPVGLAAHATAERPIEVRPVDPLDPLDPVVRPPRRPTWYRAAAPLPDAPQMHRCLLAWASDSHFLTTCMQPHGVSWLTPGFQIASLDHAMWFHRPFRMDDWLLYDVWSPSASGGRGLVRGQFHDREGRLVATVMQEGLIRDRRG